MKKHDNLPDGANIAGVPIEEPCGGVAVPAEDGNEPYIPRHLAPEGGGAQPGEGVGVPHGAYIPLADGSHIAANGAVIRRPWSEEPEIRPDHAYTEEKEDLNLLIM